MNLLNQCLTPEFIFCRLTDIKSKKQVLEFISKAVGNADHRLNEKEILTALQKREHLGSTAIGHGVAIPHARITNLKRPIVICLTLNNAIEFDSDDHLNVDIIFGLLVPEEAAQEHLNILAELSKLLLHADFRDQIRHANDADEIYELMLGKKIAVGQ